jgi:hypothetical protein
MSTYEDNLLAARFAALAPEPLPGDWADVVDRVGVRKDRRRLGLSRAAEGPRRRLLIVLAAVALLAVVTASAFAVRALVVDKGFSGLPPVGATPSTPESGVLEMYYWVHDVRGRTRNWVYADGRLIRLGVTRDNGTPLPGLREQRLTREGVELLRSEIISAGGFGHAQPPGSESLHRVNPPTIQVRKGDRLVPLMWASNRKRLEARLTDPDSWLPASAWKQRKNKAAYVPSRFEVCAAVIVKVPQNFKFQPLRAARIVTLLPAAAQNVLRGRDWNAKDGMGCFAVRTEEARSLAKALDGAGPAEKGRLNYRFNAPGPSRQVVIGFNPYLPHGETECLECG